MMAPTATPTGTGTRAAAGAAGRPAGGRGRSTEVSVARTLCSTALPVALPALGRTESAVLATSWHTAMSDDAFDPDEYPAVAVLCPELPPYPQLDASSAGDDAARASDDLAEAAALAYLCVFKPHGAEKDMRGEFASWTSALREAKLNPALWADASNEHKRAEWDADKKQGMERYIREILWTDVFRDADGPLWERVFGGTGHCHHCRARHARPSASGGEPAPLLRCATCKVAQYCSAECQKAAYWHHKRARNYDGHPVGCAAAASKARQ